VYLAFRLTIRRTDRARIGPWQAVRRLRSDLGQETVPPLEMSRNVPSLMRYPAVNTSTPAFG
jgi:hypothetical protein